MKFGTHENCCHKFKPINMTDDIFLSNGHKFLGGPMQRFSVWQNEGFLCRGRVKRCNKN